MKDSGGLHPRLLCLSLNGAHRHTAIVDSYLLYSLAESDRADVMHFDTSEIPSSGEHYVLLVRRTFV